MKCPKCRHEIKGDILPADLVFCPYCGESMAAMNEEEFSSCPFCGQKLPTGAVFCPRCGKSLKISGKPWVEQEPLKRDIKPNRDDTAQLVSAEVAKPPMQPQAYNREDISIRVNEEESEPATEEQPEIIAMKAYPKPAGEPLWPKIKLRLGKMVEPLKDFVSGHWRLRRLYHKWAKDGVFALEEVPSTEALNHITRETGGQPLQKTRLVPIIVAVIVFVAFFVFIGITMSQCK